MNRNEQKGPWHSGDMTVTCDCTKGDEMGRERDKRRTRRKEAEALETGGKTKEREKKCPCELQRVWKCPSSRFFFFLSFFFTALRVFFPNEEKWPLHLLVLIFNKCWF